MTAEPEVLVERVGSLLRLRLNRPRAINALSHAMVGELDRALDAAAADPGVAAVLLSGEGERGLCAGGDIRSLYEAPRVADGPSAAFWRDEYRLDARIAHFPRPFVSFMDGLVMGGGIGISAHAAVRIVTERSRIAMPEVGIGFVPDVGGTWILARAPGELGTMLGLTGRIIGAADAILTGFADLELPAAALPALVAALAALPPGAGPEAVRAAVAALAVAPGPAPLAALRGLIDACFAFDRVEEILAALAARPEPEAAGIAAEIAAKSPTSLKLALRLIRLARAAPDLETCLEHEFAAARALVPGPDFYEGVRAAIIDKDRNPRWSPASLTEVSDDWVVSAARPGPDLVFPAHHIPQEET